MEASMAKTNAAASGSKKDPASPPMKNTGVTASAMISVACQIAGRTSSEASRMMRAVDSVLPAARLSRRRRTMFSTSMMASSTSEPSATAKPASTIVLMVAPM
jgi:hypothetical protein